MSVCPPFDLRQTTLGGSSGASTILTFDTRPAHLIITESGIKIYSSRAIYLPLVKIKTELIASLSVGPRPAARTQRERKQLEAGRWQPSPLFSLFLFYVYLRAVRPSALGLLFLHHQSYHSAGGVSGYLSSLSRAGEHEEKRKEKEVENEKTAHVPEDREATLFAFVCPTLCDCVLGKRNCWRVPLSRTLPFLAWCNIDRQCRVLASGRLNL